MNHYHEGLAPPKPFRVLLDEATKLARQHFRRIYLPIALPLAALSAVTAASQIPFMQGLTQIGESGEFDPQLFTMLGGVGCLGLLTLALTTVAYAVLFAAGTDITAGRSVDLPARWRFFLRGSNLGTIILVSVLVVVGLLCCLLPGLYLSLLFAFVIPVMVEEGFQGITALKRSSSLVWYNPRGAFLKAPIVKVFVLYLVAGLISFSLSFLIQIPLSVLQQFLIIREAAESATGSIDSWILWLQVPASVTGSLLNTAVYLYTAIGTALLYFDCLQRQEGGDIDSALDDMLSHDGTTPTTSGIEDTPPETPEDPEDPEDPEENQ